VDVINFPQGFMKFVVFLGIL